MAVQGCRSVVDQLEELDLDMAIAKQMKNRPRRAGKISTAETADDTGPVGLMPPNFDADYVAGAVEPFLLSAHFIAETPSLPMIDLALSKEKAVPIQLWGMLYEGWAPDPERGGLSVFMQGYENRGPDNARKRIYMSATTPDLIDTKYRTKITHFYERFLADANAGKPMMRPYFENYIDLYWNLHVGAQGSEIPAEARQFSDAFNTVLGFWFPTSEIVRSAYMQARKAREPLKVWLDERVQAILDGQQADADSTFVFYWLKNGGLGENFRRIDIVFECFHNFLAFSQWGNMIYNVAARLEPRRGDPKVRAWFEKTMKDGPDRSDDGAFTPLDRFVMELFRVISPNDGSYSTLRQSRATLRQPRAAFAAMFSGAVTPHAAASMNPRHWKNPTEFDPDRYKTAPTSLDNDAARAQQIGFAQCPFPVTSFAVKDGRKTEMVNSAFGAVYPVVDGKAHPVCDTAGFAPFGFGYRRCGGEHLTIEFVKEFLRAVWRNRISFVGLDIAEPRKTPVNPGTVLNDDIAFERKA